MSTLIRPLVPTMEFGLRFDMKRIPNSIGLLLLMLLMSVVATSQADSTISCYGRVNMSITKSGITLVQPGHVTGRHDVSNLVVIMPDRSVPRLRCSDIGAVVEYTLRDTVIGISCWGELRVEDKLPYDIVCSDGTAPCETALSAIDPADFISVDDNCLTLSDLKITYSDSVGEDFPMNSDTLRLVTRTWSATDPSGLVRNCKSNIYILPLDLNKIEFPKDTSITCDQNPLDTAITGGLNVSAELLKNNCCIGFTAPNITGPLPFECGTKLKYVREWEVFDWCKGTTRSEMQIIVVKADEDKTRLVAPTSFNRVNHDCKTGIILGEPMIETDCAMFPIENTEVLITTSSSIVTLRSVGDTIFLDPGDYNLIYRANGTCPGTIGSDTAVVTVSNIVEPILVCSDSLDKAISIGTHDSLTIDLNQVYRNANIQACGDFDVLGRKLDTTGVATTEFDSLMTLYLAEAPTKLRIELVVKAASGLLSDTCTAWIDVQEKVAPTLQLHPNIMQPIVNADGTLTIDTSIIIAALGDNSGCISNVSITGSGSVMTGSGMMMTGSLTWFTDGQFQTFGCNDIGTYKVKVSVTDCDNNMTMDTTSLTISNGGGCPMMASVSGRVIAYGHAPVRGVDISMLSANNLYISDSDIDGNYIMTDVASGEDYEIEVNFADLWLNGLTAYDLSLLKHYILGLEQFDMYQRAGADIDANGEINVSDFLAVQKILLGKDVDITNEQVPWIFSNRVEEGRLIPFDGATVTVTGPTRMDWQAVKRGDIDGDVVETASTRSTSDILVTLSSSTEGGYTYKIDFGSEEEIRAFQGVIDFTSNNIEVISQHEELVLSQVEQSLTVLYYDRNPISDASDNLEVVIRSQKQLFNLGFNQQVLSSHLWKRDGSKSLMRMQLQSDALANTLDARPFNLSAFPNPTSDDVVLKLSNPNLTSTNVTISTSDVLGRNISIQSLVLDPLTQDQQMVLRLPEPSGVYLVSVQSADNQEYIRISKN